MVGSASSLLRRSSLVFTQLLRRWFRDPPTPLSPVEASTLFCVFPQRGVLFVSTSLWGLGFSTVPPSTNTHCHPLGAGPQ